MINIKYITLFAVIVLFASCDKNEVETVDYKKTILDNALNVNDNLFMLYASRPVQKNNSKIFQELITLGKPYNTDVSWDTLLALNNAHTPKDLLLLSFQLIPFENSLVIYPSGYNSDDFLIYLSKHDKDSTYWTGDLKFEVNKDNYYASRPDTDGIRKSFLYDKNENIVYGKETGIQKSIKIKRDTLPNSLTEDKYFIESLGLIDAEATEFLISYGKYMSYYKADVTKIMNPNIPDSLLTDNIWNSLKGAGKSEYWKKDYRQVWKFAFPDKNTANQAHSDLKNNIFEIVKINYDWFFYDFFGENNNGITGTENFAKYCDLSFDKNIVTVDFQFEMEMISSIISNSWEN